MVVQWLRLCFKCRGPRFQLWLGELRSHMACNVAKKKKTKQTSQKKRERERLDQGAETPTQFICLPISLSFLGKVKPLTLKLLALRQPWWNALWLMSDISFVGFTPETSETAPTLSYCVCLLWLLNTIHLVRDLQISLNLISPVYQHLGNKCP